MDLHKEPIAEHTLSPFVRSILKAVSGKGCVAGGVARYIMAQVEVPRASDIDVFMYDGQDSSELEDRLWAVGYSKVFENAYLTTYTEPNASLPVQIIRVPTAKDVYKMLDRFASYVSMYALTYEVRPEVGPVYMGYIHPNADAYNEQRILKLHHIDSPLSVFRYVQKYAGKGYHLPLADMVKLVSSWEVMSQEYKLKMMWAAHDGRTDILYEGLAKEIIGEVGDEVAL